MADTGVVIITRQVLDGEAPALLISRDVDAYQVLHGGDPVESDARVVALKTALGAVDEEAARVLERLSVGETLTRADRSSTWIRQ